jgi:hypothetical protein
MPWGSIRASPRTVREVARHQRERQTKASLRYPRLPRQTQSRWLVVDGYRTIAPPGIAHLAIVVPPPWNRHVAAMVAWRTLLYTPCQAPYRGFSGSHCRRRRWRPGRS